MTSFLINGHLALDAGSITQALTLPEQRQIDRIVVTHSHLDHTASIPFLVENTFGEKHGGLEILVTPQVMQTVKLHLFNNDTWPDFTRIPNDFLPALRLRQIEPRQPVPIDGLLLTPIPVRHIVPTHGYVVEDSDGAVIFTSDTGPDRGDLGGGQPDAAAQGADRRGLVPEPPAGRGRRVAASHADDPGHGARQAQAQRCRSTSTTSSRAASRSYATSWQRRASRIPWRSCGRTTSIGSDDDIPVATRRRSSDGSGQ